MNDPIRILVVDDDPDILSATARLLERAGNTVDMASTGEESLEAVGDHCPDLLLDRHLPGIDGAALAAGLRARWLQLKAVLMLGYTEDEALRREVGKGTVRFLQKPFDVTALALAVDEALAGRG